MLILCPHTGITAEEAMPLDTSGVETDVPALPDISSTGPEMPEVDPLMVPEKDPELPTEEDSSKFQIPDSKVETKTAIKETNRKEIQELYKQGAAFYSKKKYKDAFVTLKKAKELCGRSGNCTEELNGLYKKAKAKRAAEYANLLKLMKDADALYAKRKYHEAVGKWKQALKIEPENEKAAVNLEKTEDEIRKATGSLLEKAGQSEAAGDIAQAVLSYTAVLKLDPDNITAKDGLTALSGKRAEASKKLHLSAIDLYTKKEYAQALELWKKAKVLTPDDKQVLTNIDRCENLLREIEKLK